MRGGGCFGFFFFFFFFLHVIVNLSGVNLFDLKFSAVSILANLSNTVLVYLLNV